MNDDDPWTDILFGIVILAGFFALAMIALNV